DGVAVAAGRIFPDAEEGDHGAHERVRARPGPRGLHQRTVRGNGNGVVEPPGGGGWNGVVNLGRRLPVPADEQPLDVVPEASPHAGVVPGPLGAQTAGPASSRTAASDVVAP